MRSRAAVAVVVVALLGAGACISVERAGGDTITPPGDAAAPGDTDPQDSPATDVAACEEGRFRCADLATREKCVDGRWIFVETCSGEDICFENECVSMQGDDTCNEVFWCILVCLAAEDSSPAPRAADGPSCVEQCVLDGTAQAQQLYMSFFRCLCDNGCSQECGPPASGDPPPAPDSQDEVDCMVDHCSTPGSQCLYGGSGAQTCVEVFGCADECAPDNGPCVHGCIHDGTPTAQLEATLVFACLMIVCHESPLGEVCQAQALAGPCRDVAQRCFGDLIP